MRRTTTPTIRTADHELRLLLSVSRVITVTEATLFFANGSFFLPLQWPSGQGHGLLDRRNVHRGWLGKGVTLGPLGVLLGAWRRVGTIEKGRLERLAREGVRWWVHAQRVKDRDATRRATNEPQGRLVRVDGKCRVHVSSYRIPHTRASTLYALLLARSVAAAALDPDILHHDFNGPR